MGREPIRHANVLFLPAVGSCREPHWCPAVDLYRTEHGWLVKFDLAGVRPEDLSVRLDGRRLTVAGNRRDWCVAEGHHHYRLEITYSHFERGIELPEEPSQPRVTIEYRDGMLLVQIRTEETQP